MRVGGHSGRPFFLVTLALLALAPEATANTRGPLVGALDQAVRGARRAAPVLGVHVTDPGTGGTVYAHRADESHIVASNTKLFTTAAALEYLGPGHQVQTLVYTRGFKIGDALQGDLGIVGGGDPNISGRHHDGDPLAVFRGWARQLSERGIRRVTGDLYLANGNFEPQIVHPDWPRDQLGKWYEAPVAALSFNDNCVLVRVLPGAGPGAPGRVALLPDVPVLEIRNLTRTTNSSRSHRVSIYRPAGSNVVTVSGAIYRRAKPVEAWVSVPKPAVYFGQALRKALADEGVQFAGELKPARQLPAGNWRPLTQYRSDLLTLVEVTNQRSQNFFAESLLKLLGLEQCANGSWEAGLRVVVDFILGIGIPPESFTLADGSGMSRKNTFAPRHITRLLGYMFEHRLRREFMLSLPVSGSDHGRWDKRLATYPYRDNVLAKTGTLRGVSTLSGYAKARSGRIYAFSVLCNKTRSAWEARAAQDRIVKALIDNG